MKQAELPYQLSAESLASVEQVAQRKIRQRYQMVIALRVAILVFVLGG